MGTFHSVFARILRAEGSKLGYPSDFTIYDTDDSPAAHHREGMGLDDKLYKANSSTAASASQEQPDRPWRST